MISYAPPPLLPRPSFVRRSLLHFFAGSVVMAAALGLGVLGYRFFAHFTWIDSLLNASMILTGMGPVGQLQTTTAKLFASSYALFSGIVFLAATSVALAPLFHRLLHRFHLADVKRHDQSKT